MYLMFLTHKDIYKYGKVRKERTKNNTNFDVL